jgi:hypothetical protein
VPGAPSLPRTLAKVGYFVPIALTVLYGPSQSDHKNQSRRDAAVSRNNLRKLRIIRRFERARPGTPWVPCRKCSKMSPGFSL